MNKYQYKVQGVDYDVEINVVEGNVAKVSVNGISFEVEMKQPIKASSLTKRQPVAQHVPKPVVSEVSPASRNRENTALAGIKIKAPLPGTITELKVKVGDSVKMGDSVIILEAMKMQNNIESEGNGVVSSICVKPGDTVMEGDTLLIIG